MTDKMKSLTVDEVENLKLFQDTRFKPMVERIAKRVDVQYFKALSDFSEEHDYVSSAVRNILEPPSPPENIDEYLKDLVSRYDLKPMVDRWTFNPECDIKALGLGHVKWEDRIKGEIVESVPVEIMGVPIHFSRAVPIDKAIVTSGFQVVYIVDFASKGKAKAVE